MITYLATNGDLIFMESAKTQFFLAKKELVCPRKRGPRLIKVTIRFSLSKKLFLSKYGGKEKAVGGKRITSHSARGAPIKPILGD